MVQFGDPMLSRARSMVLADKRNTAVHEAVTLPFNKRYKGTVPTHH